jgi:hypothetical protein
MGRAASRFTQAFGFGKNNPNSGPNGPIQPSAPQQWDTTIDQLFGDAPPDENVIDLPPVLDVPIKPKKRRRAPPVPPPIAKRGSRRPLPSSPLTRRKRNRGAARAMRTPIVPEMPRRTAKGGMQAINAPFGVNRRPMILPAPISEREIAVRSALTTDFKRRPSNRRKR